MHLLEPIENWTSFMMEPLEGRVMLSAVAAVMPGLAVPTPLEQSVPLIVSTRDGGVVFGLAYSDDSGAYLTRLRADGQVDLTFGDAGAVFVPGVGSTDTLAQSPDGDLLLLAHDYVTGDLSVLRFDAHGHPDAAFGVGGRVTLPGRALTGAAMAVTGDGRVVVAEPLTPEPLPDDWGPTDAIALYRLTADGRPDDTFGDGGFLRFDPPRQLMYVEGVRVRPDGGLDLLVPPDHGGGDLWVLRTDSDGVPDRASAEGAPVTLPGAWFPDSVVLPDERAVTFASEYFGGMTLRRFAPDGSLDPTFGDGGVVRWDSDFETWNSANIVSLSDGTLVMACESLTSDDDWLLPFTPGGDRLLAFAPDGAPLPQFAGDDGRGVVVPRPSDDWHDWDIGGAAVDAADRIVNAVFLRHWEGATWGDWALAVNRFHADGTLDRSFGNGGSVFLGTELRNAPEPPLPSEPVASPSPAKPDPVQDGGGVGGAAPRATPFSISDIAREDDTALFGLSPDESLLGQTWDEIFA